MTTPERRRQAPWAQPISDYLLSRQTAIHAAYQQPQSNTAATRTLIPVLLNLLAQRLQAGHTLLSVPSMPETANTARGENKAANVWLDEETTGFIATLSSQQQQYGQHLLQRFNQLWPWQWHLLQQLLETIDSAASTSVIQPPQTWLLLIESLMSSWLAGFLQPAQAQYWQRHLLSIQHLLQWFEGFNLSLDASDSTVINSLSKFSNTINRLDFIDATKETEQSVDQPIITLKKQDMVLLWLNRLYYAEFSLVQHLQRIRHAQVPPLPLAPANRLNEQQQHALHAAAHHAFTMITGGPGTGKTFTVAQLVMALIKTQPTRSSNSTSATSEKLSLALAAPTGKAAQRMQESLQVAITQAQLNVVLPEAKTIHRLLGIDRNGVARFNAEQPLAEDLIVIDEASMLGVELASQLVAAVKTGARLLLLGDANQLAAVEAGAVLADLTQLPDLQRHHQRLTLSRRFAYHSGIGQLAALVGRTDISDEAKTQAVIQLVQSQQELTWISLDGNDQLTNKPVQNINSLSSDIKRKFKTFFDQTNRVYKEKKPIKQKSIDEIFTTLNQYRVLCANHSGSFGEKQINAVLTQQHRQHLKLPLSNTAWYHGRPIIVKQNQYDLGLFNGDIGICLQNEREQLCVYFEGQTQGIPVHRFNEDNVSTAYAMTIHKSQGSEFTQVAVMLGDSNTPLLSQELLYTAITRAKSMVTIYASASVLHSALNTPTIRQTGLAVHFSQRVD